MSRVLKFPAHRVVRPRRRFLGGCLACHATRSGFARHPCSVEAASLFPLVLLIAARCTVTDLVVELCERHQGFLNDAIAEYKHKESK